MFRCCSLETSHPRLLPQSLKDYSIHLRTLYFQDGPLTWLAGCCRLLSGSSSRAVIPLMSFSTGCLSFLPAWWLGSQSERPRKHVRGISVIYSGVTQHFPTTLFESRLPQTPSRIQQRRTAAWEEGRCPMVRSGTGGVIAAMSGTRHLRQVTSSMTPLCERQEKAELIDGDRRRNSVVLEKVVLAGKRHTWCFRRAGNELCLDGRWKLHGCGCVKRLLSCSLEFHVCPYAFYISIKIFLKNRTKKIRLQLHRVQMSLAGSQLSEQAHEAHPDPALESSLVQVLDLLALTTALQTHESLQLEGRWCKSVPEGGSSKGKHPVFIPWWSSG